MVLQIGLCNMKIPGHGDGTGSESACCYCGRRMRRGRELGLHKLRHHGDTWAALDLLEAGVAEAEVAGCYDKCIKNADKKFGARKQVKRKSEDGDVLVKQEVCRLYPQMAELQGWQGQGGDGDNGPVMSKMKVEPEEEKSWIVNEDIFIKDDPDEDAAMGITDNKDNHREALETKDGDGYNELEIQRLFREIDEMLAHPPR